MPPICPKIQLLGSGLGQLVSISNFGACCATAAVPMSANAATPASASAVASMLIRFSHTPATGSGDRYFGDYHGPNKRRTPILRWARQAGALGIGLSVWH